MPLPIIVATLAVVLVLGLNIVDLFLSADPPLRSVVGIIVTTLLLVGLVRAQRLAWQWGRYVAPLSGLVFLMAALENFALGDLVGNLVGALDLVLALGMFVFPILLNQDAAVRYFRLIYSVCGARTSKADDFFFNRAR
jgi:hypothetical protein